MVDRELWEGCLESVLERDAKCLRRANKVRSRLSGPESHLVMVRNVCFGGESTSRLRASPVRRKCFRTIAFISTDLAGSSSRDVVISQHRLTTSKINTGGWRSITMRHRMTVSSHLDQSCDGTGPEGKVPLQPRVINKRTSPKFELNLGSDPRLSRHRLHRMQRSK